MCKTLCGSKCFLTFALSKDKTTLTSSINNLNFRVMKQVSKIFLYSETFRKRISKLYDISVVDSVLDNSSDKNLFDNVVNYLIKLSNYEPNINERIIYDFK